MVAIPLRRGKALSWGLVVPSGNSSMSWLGRNALSTLHSLYQSAGDQQRRFGLSFKALVYRSFGLSTLHSLYQSAGDQQRRFRLSFKALVIDHLDSALSTTSIRVLVINKDGLGCPSKLWFIDHLDSALSTASIRVLVINKDGLGCPSKPWL